MKNPYGLNSDGRLVKITEVERGLACNCVCPACRNPLEAHKGEIRASYFSHYRGSDCLKGYETALHIMAKEIFAVEKKILLPELEVCSNKSIATLDTILYREPPLEKACIVRPWTVENFDEALLESYMDDITPDVLLIKKGWQLIVEIRVTHKVSQKKLDKIEEKGISAVEYDFSKANRYVSRKALRKVLVENYGKSGLGRSHWLFHVDKAQTIDRLNEDYRQKYLSKKKAPQLPLFE
jgi:hypothetical protein